MSNLKTILDSESGLELKNYLISKITELADINNLTEYETTASQALELKAQMRAVKKLKEILSEIMTIQNQNVIIKDVRDNYY